MNELLLNVDKIHATAKGLVRINKNLEIESEDVIAWLKSKINENTIMFRKGKNWYVSFDECAFTINASTYCVITAHIIRGY